MTRWRSLIIGGIIFGIIWGFLISSSIRKLIQHFESYKVENHIYQTYADQLKISDEMVSFDAIDRTQNKHVKAIYFFKNNREREILNRQKGCLFFNVDAEVQLPDQPTNENQFDYRQFLQSRNINQIVKVTKINRIDSGHLNLGSDYGHRIRSWILKNLNRFPTALKGYAKALILGIIDDDFQVTITQIRKLGLLYLFCLSGMHVFFIRKYLMMIGTLFKIPIEGINLILLAGFSIYLIIGGGSLSLSRAIWMSWFAILSQFALKQCLSGIECWSIVLIAGLFKFPLMFFSLGALLSYLMTFILLLADHESAFKMNFKLNNFSIPLILNSTYQWNILTSGLAFVVGWIFEKLIFPITFLGSLIPGLKDICNQLLLLIDQIFVFLTVIPSTITFGKLPVTVGVLIILMMFLNENHRHRSIKWAIIGMLYLGSWLWICFPLKSKVIYFDIGQGDATLIQKAFQHRVVLIDTGGKLNYGRRQPQNRPTAGQRIIANYLLSKGLTMVDGLYLTHQDTDHIGYMPSIGAQIRYNKIYVPAGMEKLGSFQQKLARLDQPLKKIIPVTDQISSKDFKIMYPFKEGKGANQDSMVLYQKIGNCRFLFTGDLDQAGELKVIDRYSNLKVDVLKVGHHGSKTSSNPQFVDQIAPKLAIISAGRNNRYHHPNLETLQMFNERSIPFLNTAESGMIQVEINDSKINVTEWLKR